MIEAVEATLPAPALPVPQPRPPQTHRPTKLSVSDVHLLQTDPYGYFAKRVLKLRPLEKLAADPTAAERGNLVHAIAHRFVVERSRNPTADRVALFRRIAQEQMATMAAGAAARAFLSGQLARLATYFVEIDAALSENAIATLAEVEGETEIVLDNVSRSTLTARADRIDVFGDSVSIVDYKTGSIPSTDENAQKFHPQLLLEAMIAARGGFTGIGRARVKAASFVKLSGRDVAGDQKPVKDLFEKTQSAEEGLRRLLSAYADERQAYKAVIPGKGYGDYDLLSRWKEWSSRLADTSSEGSGNDRD
jgi:ATP-dependent helicase/nuclease subunit B